MLLKRTKEEKLFVYIMRGGGEFYDTIFLSELHGVIWRLIDVIHVKEC